MTDFIKRSSFISQFTLRWQEAVPSGTLVSHCCDNFQLKISLGRECWEHKRCPVVWQLRRQRHGSQARTGQASGKRAPPPSLTKAARGPKLINTQHVTHAHARAHTHTDTHTCETEANSRESPQVKNNSAQTLWQPGCILNGQLPGDPQPPWEGSPAKDIHPLGCHKAPKPPISTCGLSTALTTLLS